MMASYVIPNLLILTDSVVAIGIPQLRLESQDFEARYCGDKRLYPMLDNCQSIGYESQADCPFAWKHCDNQDKH
jgi:hypothetical protein